MKLKRVKVIRNNITPEMVSRWRIVPRIIVVLYGYTFWKVTEWFMGLADPTATQAAFISAVVGAGAAFFGLYVNSGASLKEIRESYEEPDGNQEGR